MFKFDNFGIQGFVRPKWFDLGATWTNRRLSPTLMTTVSNEAVICMFALIVYRCHCVMPVKWRF